MEYQHRNEATMVDAITLTTSDGVCHNVSRDVAIRSRLIHSIMDPDANVVIRSIPLALTSTSLGFVLEHFNGTLDLSTLDRGELVAAILAANFMDVPDMLQLTSRALAASLRGKTTDEMREHFGILNDLSAEEEALVRRENFWTLSPA